MGKIKDKDSETNIPDFLNKIEDINGDNIHIIGARMHNLKNLNITIPKNKIIAVTGVSGSGKSSLAFDILFEEGRNR